MECKKILQSFVEKLRGGGDFSLAGVETAFTAFVNSLEVNVYKPPAVENNNYVRTTLQEAVEASKRPVLIPAEVNKFGRMESLVYVGMIFEKDPEDGQWTASSLQDESGNLSPLTMNALLVCRSNGWRFNGKNLAGSASVVSSDLRKG
jgi:hypothetical protein